MYVPVPQIMVAHLLFGVLGVAQEAQELVPSARRLPGVLPYSLLWIGSTADTVHASVSGGFGIFSTISSWLLTSDLEVDIAVFSALESANFVAYTSTGIISSCWNEQSAAV